MDVIIIGGGPAGMMAAISSAKCGNNVTILEKTEMLGKKILISGKGRCNITSSLPIEDFIKNIPGNGMFLYSAFNKFDNKDVIKMLEDEGVKTKVERGNRVFPISDNSKEVRNAFARILNKLNVNIKLNTKVIELIVDEEKVIGVKCESNGKRQDIKCNKIIIATGGQSYPGTGSTGDGYIFARNVGHKVTKIRPSLVGYISNSSYCKKMQGLSLKNIAIKIMDIEKNKCIYEDFGEMIFTHLGMSGPVILSSSAHLLRYKNVDELLMKNKIKLYIDLKPALSEKKLDDRILRDFAEEKNKAFKNSLDKLLPKKMIDVVIEMTKINPDKKVNEITKVEREMLVKTLKNFEININNFGDIKEAIITSGGVDIKQINPKTMESKIIPGLFFAGEVIDVDAYTGGFNLQIAYSTGFCAGDEN